MRTQLFAVVLIAGCTPTDSRIAVAESNDLGIVSLQTDHQGDAFALRALDAADAQVASVTIRRGELAELAGMGSEIVVAVRGASQRVITREVERYELRFADAQIQQLMAIPTVASTLESEEHVTLLATSTHGVDVAYSATGCGSAELLTTPTARHCCEDYGPNGAAVTSFLRADNILVQRVKNQNFPGGGCKSQTNGWCSGNSCYYGPFGYARAVFYSPSSNGWSIQWGFWIDGNFNSDSYCSLTENNSPPVFDYSDVDGSQATGGGCCINGSGPCNIPGKPLCTSCGGGGAAGTFSWDY